jgi:hypothetical protein
VTAPVISKHGFRYFELRDPDSHILRFIQATSDRPTGDE